ncbi:MAG: type II toxin-antitoxin system VapC family toxin, partial [Ornithinimicrobium sp.]
DGCRSKVTALLTLDTSVAVPLLVTSHSDHERVHRWWSGRAVSLAGHASIETYSVLTRLPGQSRLTGEDAARLIANRFPLSLPLTEETQQGIPQFFADIGIAGGAVYDGLVALAALEHGAVLATRDARAAPTYERVGARVELLV